MNGYVTKAERKYRNHWNRKVWRKVNNDWETALAPIENKYLKIKIATLIFFDGSDENLAEGRDFTYLRSLCSQYRFEYEHGYTLEDIEQALIDLGYPKKTARRRSQVPKGWYNYNRHTTGAKKCY